jgi:hypothetical protein
MAPTLMGFPLLVGHVEHEYKCTWCSLAVAGPAPPVSPPIPPHQRFGLAVVAGLLVLGYGVWWGGNAAIDLFERLADDRAEERAAPARAEERAAPARAEAAEAARLDAARARAEQVLARASEAESDCRQALRKAAAKSVADVAFWSGKKMPAAAPSVELTRVPYDGIPAAPSTRSYAEAVGGFACVVSNAEKLGSMVHGGGASAETLTALAEQVEAEGAALSPPRRVVESQGGCKLDQRWCRVALVWVDVEARAVTGAVWKDTAYVKDGDNEPGLARAKQELIAEVGSWPR